MKCILYLMLLIVILLNCNLQAQPSLTFQAARKVAQEIVDGKKSLSDVKQHLQPYVQFLVRFNNDINAALSAITIVEPTVQDYLSATDKLQFIVDLDNAGALMPNEKPVLEYLIEESYNKNNAAVLISGYKTLIEELFKNNINVNKTNKHNETPIYAAIYHQDIPLIQKLLSIPSINVDIQDKAGVSPLKLAVMRKDNIAIVKLLAPRTNSNAILYDALKNAILSNHDDIAKLLISMNKVDVNQAEGNLLWIAMENLNSEMVRFLIHAGVDVSSVNIGYLRTPESKFSTIIRKHKKDADGQLVEDEEKMQKLRTIIKDLLATGKVNVNLQNPRGQTPLIRATKMSDLAIMKLLVNAGADINIKDVDGKIALDYAPTKAIYSYLKSI